MCAEAPWSRPPNWIFPCGTGTAAQSRDVYPLKIWTELSSSIFDDPTFIEHLSPGGLLLGSTGGSGGGAACCLDRADLSGTLSGSGRQTRGDQPVREPWPAWYNWWPLIGQPSYIPTVAHEAVASLAVASAASTLAPLGGVASLGAPTPGNPGNRGMEATLGLRASPTACRTGGQLSSPKSAGTQVQLGRRSCFHFRAWESRSAVLCEYTIRLNWFLAVCTVCTQCTLY